MQSLVTISMIARALFTNGTISADVGCAVFNRTSERPAGDTFDPPTYRTYNPIRISDGVICNSALATGPNGTCPVQAWAYTSYGFRFNVTFPSGISSPFPDDTISAFAHNGTISGTVSNATFFLLPGQAGYVEFLEEYSCTTGQLDNCAGDFDFNGTYVEACYPTYNTGTGTTPMFYNTAQLVSNASAAYVASLGPNPYALPIYAAANETISGNSSAVATGSNATGVMQANDGVSGLRLGGVEVMGLLGITSLILALWV